MMKEKDLQTQKKNYFTFNKQDFLILFFLIVIFLSLRIPRLDFPQKFNLDEYYYVPGGKSYFTPHKDPNPRHPPLAKILIGTSIKIFGDNPAGWRAGSVIFGLLILILVYLMGLLIFKNRVGATAGALLLNIDFLHIVQSRIATLDIYVSFFILLSFFFAFLYSKEWLDNKKILTKYSILTGISLGLAVSCKLSGLFASVGVGLYLLIIFFLNDKKKAFKSVLGAGIQFALLITVIYIGMHIPLFLKGEKFSYIFYRETFALHYTMKMEHPQLSSMTEWIFVQKPIWYVWINSRKTFTITGITGMGSYPFWWGFLILFARMIYLAVKKKEPGKILVVTAYLALYLCWLSSFQVRNGEFHFKGGFSYYMLPCIPFMALTVADIINDIWEKKPGKINALIYFGVLIFYLYKYFPVLNGMTMGYYYFSTLYFKGITKKDPAMLIIVTLLITLQLFTPYILNHFKKNPEKQS